MNKHVRKHKPARRSPFLLTAIFVLPLSLIAAFSLSPDVGELTEKAALLSAMVNMPEGSIALLESRFADKIDESYYREGENQVASYVEPFDDDEGADSQAPSEESAPTSSAPESMDGPAKTTDPSPARDNSHQISEEYRGTILQENMSGSGTNLIAYGEGLLRNYTELPADEIESIMEQGMNIHLEDTPEPQVLIFHTHATESYEPYDSENYDMRNTWRSTDNTNNMIVVGDALEQALKDAGIGVIHDRTQHDYPSYNGAYERSAETIKSYLEKYPTSDKRYYDIGEELKRLGLTKAVVLPPVQKQAYILPEGKHDPYHIMHRMVERHITDDEIRGYMNQAEIMMVQWGGRRQVFYGHDGVCVITKSGDDWIYKTAWKKEDFDSDTGKILEVMKKYVK